MSGSDICHLYLAFKDRCMIPQFYLSPALVTNDIPDNGIWSLSQNNMEQYHLLICNEHVIWMRNKSLSFKATEIWQLLVVATSWLILTSIKLFTFYRCRDCLYDPKQSKMNYLTLAIGVNYHMLNIIDYMKVHN